MDIAASRGAGVASTHGRAAQLESATPRKPVRSKAVENDPPHATIAAGEPVPGNRAAGGRLTARRA